MSTGFEVIIRPFVPADQARCERVLRSLPEWFGIEDSNQQYIRDFAALETLVAQRAGDVVGVITLKTHTPVAVELWFLAVERSLHRQASDARCWPPPSRWYANAGCACCR